MYTRPLRLKSELQNIQGGSRERIPKRIRDVMTDNSRKLCMGEMGDICFTRRYDTAQNRTGCLNDMRLLPSWAEVLNAATFVRNRMLTMPAKALGGRTPYEVLYVAKPDVSHFRAFAPPCSRRSH
jgi:hypothetical protein